MRKAKEFTALIMQELQERDPDSVEEAIEKHVREAMSHVLWSYAWMKDGVSYVGCGIRLYKDVLKEL